MALILDRSGRSEEDCLESFACGGTGTGNQEPGTVRETGLTGPRSSFVCGCMYRYVQARVNTS